MSEHPHQLYAVEFTEADQPPRVGFSCGEELWSRHVAEWIRGSDVLDSMKRGTRVWLFETERGEVVGFGSIGTSQWQWPPPRGSRTTVVLIPMLGLDVRFRGVPPDPAWRYSRQLMAHLIAEGQRAARVDRGTSEEAARAGAAGTSRERTSDSILPGVRFRADTRCSAEGPPAHEALGRRVVRRRGDSLRCLSCPLTRHFRYSPGRSAAEIARDRVGNTDRQELLRATAAHPGEKGGAVAFVAPGELSTMRGCWSRLAVWWTSIRRP